jgi:hypothetical protein
VAATSFDAAKGSSFTVRFEPPACFGTPPTSSVPHAYTVHWEMLSDSDLNLPADRRPRKGSLQVSTKEAHHIAAVRAETSRERWGKGERKAGDTSPSTCREDIGCTSAADQSVDGGGHERGSTLDVVDWQREFRSPSAPLLKHGPEHVQASGSGRTPGVSGRALSKHSSADRGGGAAAGLEYKVVVEIQCPAEGSEDLVRARLIDAATYRVWVVVECQHVQPDIANVTSKPILIHLPFPPASPFVSHRLSFNTAATRCMQLYRALYKAAQRREELLESITEFDHNAMAPQRLWTKSSSLLAEQVSLPTPPPLSLSCARGQHVHAQSS